MVKLEGELAFEAQEALGAMHEGIDIGKRIVTATHNLENKLLAFDYVMMHIEFNYSHHDEIYTFFTEISDIIAALNKKLNKIRRGGLHFIAEEKTIENWILKHKLSEAGKRVRVWHKIIATIKWEKREEVLVNKRIIRRLNADFQKLKKLYSEADHLFLIHEEKAKITEIKLKLEEDEERVKHILEQVMRFIFTYEKLLGEMVRELESKD